MCQSIMALSNALIYDNKLRCGSPDISNAKLKFSSIMSGSSWLNEVKWTSFHCAISVYCLDCTCGWFALSNIWSSITSSFLHARGLLGPQVRTKLIRYFICLCLGYIICPSYNFLQKWNIIGGRMWYIKVIIY